MVEYEVNLQVEDDIADAYLPWLREHITAMLALPGFTGAELLRVHEPVPAGHVAWCVRYRLRDAEALQMYLARYAPTMRADAVAHFGERFVAARRVLIPLPDRAAPQQPSQT